MLKVSQSKWDGIPADYKGEWKNYYDERPEWIGRKVVMGGCIAEDPTELGKLLIEGVHFEIVGTTPSVSTESSGHGKDDRTLYGEYAVDIKTLWNRYYAEYIREHRNEDIDVYQLTNEAITYTMKKLGWDCKMPCSEADARNDLL